ncbi:MAG: imidazole glycerol phosphate synthase subunit HisH, partial [Firmicutes bacterium]|nr:imidazole glycerol phosphate synthase subunit HisH [Bacillota bacterium]
NLRSVQKGFERAGYPALLARDPASLAAARGLVLPGVGAFGDAMRRLRAAGLVPAIERAVAEGRPLLGICLGQQLLFEESEEWGPAGGLGLLRGRVRRLPPGVKVPHMGWNGVAIRRPSALLEGIPDGSLFYFVHSYYVEPVQEDLVVGTTDYGLPFASVVAWGNVFGTQFHPEKSGALGLRILANFGRLVCGADHTGR